MRSDLPSIVVASFLWLVGSLTGATITVTNFDGVESNLITNARGKLLTSGTVRLGSFGFSDAEVRSAFERQAPQEVMAAFSQFGHSVAVNFDGLPGLYQSTIQDTISSDHSLLGESIYTVITDTPSLETAAEWLVFRHDQVFLEDPLPNQPALLNATTPGELLVGLFGNRTATVGQIIDGSVFGLVMVIPEPSASVLLLLSIMLAIVPRRRRLIFPLSS